MRVYGFPASREGFTYYGPLLHANSQKYRNLPSERKVATQTERNINPLSCQHLCSGHCQLKGLVELDGNENFNFDCDIHNILYVINVFWLVYEVPAKNLSWRHGVADSSNKIGATSSWRISRRLSLRGGGLSSSPAILSSQFS